MAIALRATTTGPNANAASTSVNLPTGTTTGDIVIAAFIHYQGSSSAPLTAPSGWTVICNATGFLVCWRAYQSGDPSSITASSSTSNWWQSMTICYSGADTSNPIDAANFQFNIIGGNGLITDVFRAPNVNPRYNGSQLVAIFAEASSGGHSFTVPSGLTARVTAYAGPNLLVCDKALTDGTPTGDISASCAATVVLHAGVQIALKASGAALASAAAARPVIGGFTHTVTGTDSYTVPLDLLNVQDGDRVVVMTDNASGSVTSPPGGFTQHINTSGGASIYSKTWHTGDSTGPTFAYTAIDWRSISAFLIRAAGNGTAIVDQFGINTSGTGTVSAPSLTPSTANDLLLCHFGSASGNTSGSWTATPSGMSIDAKGEYGPGSVVCWKYPSDSPSGSQSATWSLNGTTGATLLFTIGSAGVAAAARPQVFVCT